MGSQRVGHDRLTKHTRKYTLPSYPLPWFLFWESLIWLVRLRRRSVKHFVMDCSPQSPRSSGFSRQESWSGLPWTPPGDLPNPGMEPESPETPALQEASLITEPWGEPTQNPVQFSSVQSLSCVRFFATPWIAARQASLSITSSRSLLKPMSIESVMPSNHLILCHPLLLLPPIPPSSRVFSNSQLFPSGGQSIGVSASASVRPMNAQDWSPSGWTGWISLQSKGLSRVFANATVQKHHSSALSFLHSPTLTSIHDHWKNHSLD